MTGLKEIIDGLLDQARDKDILDGGDRDIFANDARILRMAAEMLKAREAVKPERSGRSTTWYYCCGQCGQLIDPGDLYCRRCGRAVKWDD